MSLSLRLKDLLGPVTKVKKKVRRAPLYGNVTALEGLVARDREIQGQTHHAHMLQACGLGFSQVMSP